VTIPVTGLTLTPKNYSAIAGIASELQLTAIVSPSNATDKTVSYIVSPQTSGLTVGSTGKASWSDLVASGDYVIAGKTTDGNFTDTVTLTLTEPEAEE
jgi:uncharacterized protein YjdB